MSAIPTGTYKLRGHIIATDRERRGYAIEVEEAKKPPEAFSRFFAGKHVEPTELYEALDGEGRDAIGDSEDGLKYLELILGKLRQCFPDEVGHHQ